MNELRRICNKKYIILIIMLMLFNAFLILNDNEDVEYAKVYDEMIDIANENYDDEKTWTECASDAWKIYFDRYKEDEASDNDIAKNVRNRIVNEAKYIDDYRNEIELKKQEAIIYIKSGTYEKNSFEYNNLLKTRYDLSKISDADVKISNGIWLEKLFENNYMHMFALIACIFVVYMFFMERKKGLYNIIYASSGGRGALFFSRCLILLGQSLVINVILYTESVILLLKMYGGRNGLNIAAVSSEYFFLTTGEMTRIEFVVLMVVVSALTTAALSLLLWLVMLCFSNVNIGMFFYCFMCLADILLYKLIPAKSVFKLVKYVNLYYLLFQKDAINYYNWGYGDAVITILYTTIVISLAVGIISLFINANICIREYFENKENIIERLMKNVSLYLMSIMEKTGNCAKEIYKILFSQRILLVLILLVYVAINIEPRVGVIYDAKKSYLLGYYEEAQGLSYGPELLSIYDKYKQEYEEFSNSLDYSMSNANVVLANRQEMLRDIENNVNYLKKMNDCGVKAVVVRPYEYMDSMGSKEYDNQEMLAFLNLIAAVIISCGFISYEKKVMVHKIIVTCSERRRWLVKKILVQVMLVFLFALFTYGVYYVKLWQRYNYDDITAPLKSIMEFENYLINPTIFGFVILDFINKMLLLISVQLFFSVISIYVKYLFGFVTGAIILIPHLLYMIGFNYIHRLSIPRFIAFFPYVMENVSVMNSYWLVFVPVIIMGITAYIYIVKKETAP